MAVALVIGSANSVWSDYDRANLLLDELEKTRPNVGFETFVINDTIPVFPDFMDFAITLHPDKLRRWAQGRNANGFNAPRQTWSLKRDKLVTNVSTDWGGSSGLYACKIAMEKGYQKIILCGVPMEPSFEHIVRNSAWNAAKQFRRGWERHMNDVKDMVRSFGGWTMEKLGSPTIEWISDIPDIPINKAIA